MGSMITIKLKTIPVSLLLNKHGQQMKNLKKLIEKVVSIKKKVWSISSKNQLI
jgi:hypothetical protein